MQYDHLVTGRVIAALRERKGLTQEILSGLSGIARSHLAMIENGTRSPSVDTLWRISAALGLPLSDLIRRIEAEIEQREG